MLLAGGIGITPYYSLIKYIDFKKLPTKVTLIASFDFFENIIFKSELEKIQIRNKNIKVIYTLTKENHLFPGFEKGRIRDKLIKGCVKLEIKSFI